MVIDIIHQVKWNELKNQLHQRWNKLTDDDLSNLDGGEEDLIAALRKRYGYGKEQADIEIKKWLHNVSSNKPGKKRTLHKRSDS